MAEQLRKIAFVRQPGFGGRAWAGARYAIPGISPSHSLYDFEGMSEDTGIHYRVHNNVQTTTDPRGPKEPTMNRSPRVGAQFSSLAALPIFQSGWQTRWSYPGPPLPVPRLTRQLNMNNNPNAPGRAEQQRATVYDPWPSAGALYPKAV